MNMSNFLYRVYVIVRRFSRALGIMGWIDRSMPVIKAARWMRESIAGGSTVVITEPMYGHRMQTNPDYIDLIKGQGYEKGTTKLFTELVKEGMNVVDIGANIGYYTLLAARRVGPHGRVYAFEPEPQNFKLLTENLRLNGYKNVIAVQKAVSNKSGTVSLFLGMRGSGTHSLVSTRDYSKEAIGIEAVTLDEFFEKAGTPDIHVIKMDIEGWEIEALDGMRNTVIHNSPLSMLLEFYPWGLLTRNMNPKALIDKVTQLGFSISIIDDETGQTTSLSEYHRGQIDQFVVKHKTAVNLLAQK